MRQNRLPMHQHYVSSFHNMRHIYIKKSKWQSTFSDINAESLTVNTLMFQVNMKLRIFSLTTL